MFDFASFILRGRQSPDLDSVEMAYTNWQDVRAIRYAQWTSVDSLLSWLRGIRYMSFYIRANRDRIRVLYESLLGMDVVGRTRRFPAEGYYVCLDNAHTRSIIDTILHALDMPDRQYERSGMDVASAGDAKRAFEVSVSELIRVIVASDEGDYLRYGIYDRVSFETTFALVWE